MSLRWTVVERAPAAWDALSAGHLEATPGHRPELWDVLAAALPGGAARFVAVEAGGTFLGGMGLVVERRAGCEWLHALPWLLGGAPLARPGDGPLVDEACAAALAELSSARRAVGGEWTLYRPAGGEIGSPALARVPGETTRVETAVVDLASGLAAAEARLGRRLRQYLRHPESGLEFREEPEALEAAYVLHTRQARAWTGFTPLPLELSRRLLAADFGAPLARLFTVRAAGRLEAATLFLDHPRELLAWWSGIHPRARGRHLFPLLLWNAVRWGWAAGRARVNLGGSAGRSSLVAFKEALGAREIEYPVRWLAPVHATPAGRALASLQAWRRRDRPRGAAG